MPSINRILFPTDFSKCSECALPQAHFLAKKFEATLHVFYVLTTDLDLWQEDNVMTSFIAESWDLPAILKRETPQKQIELEREATIVKGVSVVREGAYSSSAQEGILDYANDNDIDLIVMATHGKSGMERFLLGSTAEKVLRHAVCPVLSIRCRQSKKASVPEDIKSILAPIDFSSESRQALKMAKQWAAMYNARLDLLHIVEDLPLPPFYKTGGFVTHQVGEDIELQARRQLRILDQIVKGPKEARRFESISGNVAHEIISYANHYADLVVLTSHGLSGIKQFLIGSVAEKVLRRAECPVLTIKTSDKMLSNVPEVEFKDFEQNGVAKTKK